MEIDADPRVIRSQQPYRTSPKKRRLINDAVEQLLELDVIEPSNSQVASPVVVVIQKGKPRFCVDLREVNSKTIADRYALPKQDSIFRALAKAIYFSIIDANRGYHQFGLKRMSRFLTAFVTEDGFWQFKRMPFGLKNAPSHFQRAIDTILGTYRFEFALAFIDDIVIFSQSLAEHILHVSLVLEALEKVGMTVSEKKCHFGYKSIELLGRRVSRLGLATQEEKVKAIMDLPYPRTIGEASELFGQFNYHRDFIKGFAEIAKPITDGMSPQKGRKVHGRPAPHKMTPKEYAKMRSNAPFPDSKAIRDAFAELKKALSTAPVLVHPDFEKEFILYTDACRKGIAGALYQMSDDNKEHPVLFISRNLTDAETRYSATELECLGVVWSLNKLEHYVDGSKLKLYTDHTALKWIWDIKSTANSRLFKWSLMLNPLRDKVTIIHRPGRLHNNVDPLSRYPVANSVNLLSVNDEWKAKLWRGYLRDRYFRRILKRLMENQAQQKAIPQYIDVGIREEPKSQDKGRRKKDKKEKPSDVIQEKDMTKEYVEKLSDAAQRLLQSRRKEKKSSGSEFIEAQDKGGEKKKGEGKEEKEKSRKEKEKSLAEYIEAQDKGGEKKKSKGKEEKEKPLAYKQIEAQDKGGERKEMKDGEEKGNLILLTEVGEKEDEYVEAQDKGQVEDKEEGQEPEKENDQDDVRESESEDMDLDSIVTFYDNIRDKPTTFSDGTFSLIDNCLFFSERQESTLRLCIPNDQVDEILQLCHDKRAHPGIRRTYSSIAARFFFPKMSRQIKHHVNNCLECQTSKPSNEKGLGLLQSIKTHHPHHTLCMDFITGLPSSDGYNALLTVTDAYTKAIKLIPCHDTTSAKDTAELFLRHGYPLFGLPSKIISDRDARFTSRFWSTLMKLLDVKLGMTTAYHPQADGQSERTNQTIEVALRCLIGGDVHRYEKWINYLPIVEHEYNSTVHESTGFSPNQLRYTVQPRGLTDLMYPLEGSSESAEQLAQELKNRQDEARDSIAVAQRKQKKYYDQKKKKHEFNVGDLVVLKLNRFGPGYRPAKPHLNKLGPTGTPLRIVEKISPLAYRLDLPQNAKIHDVVSIVHLKRFRGLNHDIRPLPVQVEDGGEEYEVESIEGQRTNAQGTVEYLVKWKGYGDHERTWEPLAHLAHSDEAVAKWHAKRPDPPAKRKPKSARNVSTTPPTDRRSTRQHRAT
jgi:hypothetical protein